MLRTGQPLKVSLKHFDSEAHIEVLDREIIAYLKERGIGGLAVGSSGRIVSLISAGFDSPVASFMLMKRGARILPLHFHSAPVTSDEPIAAVRIVLLRRSFMRLSCRYASDGGALALATGESLGQVASQTLENMRAIDDAATLPVMRPLCGLNKTEIIDIARRIGTADISARPCEDGGRGHGGAGNGPLRMGPRGGGGGLNRICTTGLENPGDQPGCASACASTGCGCPCTKPLPSSL